MNTMMVTDNGEFANTSYTESALRECKRFLSEINIEKYKTGIRYKKTPVKRVTYADESGYDIFETHWEHHTNPKDVDMPSGLLFCFPRDAYKSGIISGKPTIYPFVCEEFYEKYESILDAIRRPRLIDDKTEKFLENMDSQRKKLHNEAAKNVKNYLLHEEEVEVDLPAARKIVEGLYYIWLFSREGDMYYPCNGKPMDDETKKRLKEMVREETGVDVKDIHTNTHGFHEDYIKTEYVFKFTGDHINKKMRGVERIISRFIEEHEDENQ